MILHSTADCTECNKKVKTVDKLFLVSKWQDIRAAIDTVKERVSEYLKFVFHKKVHTMMVL